MGETTTNAAACADKYKPEGEEVVRPSIDERKEGRDDPSLSPVLRSGRLAHTASGRLAHTTSVSSSSCDCSVSLTSHPPTGTAYRGHAAATPDRGK